MLVLEREPEIATHQTGHNSGVIHAGIYYAPGLAEGPALHRGPQRAVRVLRRARDRRTSAAASSSSPSTSPSSPALDELERRGVENGVPGLRRLDAAEIARDRAPRRRRRRPALPGDGHRRLRRRRPRHGRRDPCARRHDPHGRLRRAPLPLNGTPRSSHTSAGPIPAARAVACAGLWSDRLADRLRRVRRPPNHPVPRRLPEAQAPTPATSCESLIYPVPDPSLPFLGVHLTKTIHGDDLARPHRPPRPIPHRLLPEVLRPRRRALHARLAGHLANGPPLLANRPHRDVGFAARRRAFVAACAALRPSPRSPPTSKPAQPASEPKP